MSRFASYSIVKDHVVHVTCQELGGLNGNTKCTKCQDLQSVEVGHYKEADEENSKASF